MAMQVGSLTNAAHSARRGMNRVTKEVEQVASSVAAGTSSDPGGNASDSLAAMSRLSELKQQAQANAQVSETADDLFAEMATTPRR